MVKQVSHVYTSNRTVANKKFYITKLQNAKTNAGNFWSTNPCISMIVSVSCELMSKSTDASEQWIADQPVCRGEVTAYQSAQD